jgi:hypothetical protein
VGEPKPIVCIGSQPTQLQAAAETSRPANRSSLLAALLFACMLWIWAIDLALQVSRTFGVTFAIIMYGVGFAICSLLTWIVARPRRN